MSRKLQIKRGNAANLPNLSEGEFGLVLDQKKLYIGSGSKNLEIANADLSNVPAATLKAKVEESGFESIPDNVVYFDDETTTGDVLPVNADLLENKTRQSIINDAVAAAYTYGTEDLTEGESPLETGRLYFVYQ